MDFINPPAQSHNHTWHIMSQVLCKRIRVRGINADRMIGLGSIAPVLLHEGLQKERQQSSSVFQQIRNDHSHKSANGGGAVSSGTCVCGTAPPAAPDSEEKPPAAGRDAGEDQRRSLAPADHASTSSPENPSGRERSDHRTDTGYYYQNITMSNITTINNFIKISLSRFLGKIMTLVFMVIIT